MDIYEEVSFLRKDFVPNKQSEKISRLLHKISSQKEFLTVAASSYQRPLHL